MKGVKQIRWWLEGMWGPGDDGDTEVCSCVGGNVQAEGEKDGVQKEGDPKKQVVGAPHKWRGWPETGDMLHPQKGERKGQVQVQGGNDDQLLLSFSVT